jgi:hypothetical protein
MNKFRQIFMTVVIFLLLFSALAYGDTWSTSKRLTWSTRDSWYPAIAVDGPNIYVVWENYTIGAPEIYFKKSNDGGDTWTTSKRLTNNAGGSILPTIAVNGSSIYVAWADNTPDNYEIYFKKSDDGGDTWTISKRLTWNAGNSFVPKIAVDGLNIYLVWEDYTPVNLEIYFKQSFDGGATWTSNKRLTNTPGASFRPAMAVDGLNIYLVWADDWADDIMPGDYEIYFKKSDNGGDTWTTSKRLTNNAGRSFLPTIAVNGSTIYVVWEDDTPPGNDEIYFKKSDNGGDTWTTNKRLTWNVDRSEYPAIAVNGSTIYVVWEDNTLDNDEIYFKKSNDGGDTWTTSKRLTWNAGDSQYPAIAVDGSNIYVVWQSSLPVIPQNFEIYFKKGVLF